MPPLVSLLVIALPAIMFYKFRAAGRHAWAIVGSLATAGLTYLPYYIVVGGSAALEQWQLPAVFGFGIPLLAIICYYVIPPEPAASDSSSPTPTDSVEH